ncbi:FAD-dependent oxidoreductase [Streptomyces sp. NPDC052415]|uniref:FAD-dependent oxidoreductase n=1 Tax=Streptomyces sp. NPDC052415 TaxID=3365690 RepID=UPI0037CCE327
MKHIVVAGGSIAATTAVSTLRAHGWNGKITLVTDEDTPPYSRVPLSKGVLSGALAWDAATLPALPDDVDVRLNTRTVTLSDRTDLCYDGLVIATGSRPRRLAADGQQGERVVRTLADTAAINARLRRARSAVVVGAGFLGMEVASTLRAHGLAVTVIDREPPLRRLIGPWLADLVTAAAAEAGVDFVLAPTESP